MTDLLKPELSFGYLANFLLLVIVLVLIFSLGLWFSEKVKTAVAGPKGSQRRIEEPRI